LNKKQFHDLYKKSFLKFVQGNFLWPIFFWIFYQKCKYEKSQFQCSITSLLLVLEQKIVLTEYRKSYQRNLKMFSNLTFGLNFKVKTRSICWFYTKNVCKSVPVVAIKFIFRSEWNFILTLCHGLAYAYASASTFL
jgi:hypothetical protein